jgi:peptidoglycan/xylan/chitin deacetylase (PgdA/CDA1 family)
MKTARPGTVLWPGGVVSFTFDDFPKSALIAGGTILQKYGCRGTFYTALGLAGTEDELGVYCEPEDVLAAHEQGHEIACHTHTHLDCGRARPDAIVADIAENEAELSALLGGYLPQSFAYPFGEVSLAAKQAVADRFSSCRGISGGFNRGRIDLAELRATKLYATDYDETRLRSLIDRTCQSGGWLIFYTHDIRAIPSRYGCTPTQFEAMVVHAARHATVLPVGEVMARLGYACIPFGAVDEAEVPSQLHQGSQA